MTQNEKRSAPTDGASATPEPVAKKAAITKQHHVVMAEKMAEDANEVFQRWTAERNDEMERATVNYHNRLAQWRADAESKSVMAKAAFDEDIDKANAARRQIIEEVEAARRRYDKAKMDITTSAETELQEQRHMFEMDRRKLGAKYNDPEAKKELYEEVKKLHERAAEEAVNAEAKVKVQKLTEENAALKARIATTTTTIEDLKKAGNNNKPDEKAAQTIKSLQMALEEQKAKSSQYEQLKKKAALIRKQNRTLEEKCQSRESDYAKAEDEKRKVDDENRKLKEELRLKDKQIADFKTVDDGDDASNFSDEEVLETDAKADDDDDATKDLDMTADDKDSGMEKMVSFSDEEE